MEPEFFGPAFGPDDNIRDELENQNIDVPDDFLFPSDVPDIADFIPDDQISIFSLMKRTRLTM